MIQHEQSPHQNIQAQASFTDWLRTLVRAQTAEERQRWRWAGSIVAIIINALLLLIAHRLPDARVPFITAEWSAVLWAIDLSLSASIVAQALFMVYDRPWFRGLVEIATTGLALLVWLTLRQVFPFDFGDGAANELARLIGMIVIVALVIALIVQAIVWVVDRARTALR